MMKMFAAAAIAITLMGIGDVHAAEHEIRMLNKGAKGAMVFEPDFIRAAPGDTIRFVPTDKTHNAESIKGMLPEGAEVFRSKVNEDFAVTLSKEGVYGVKCTPHYTMGMVMLVVVGKPANLDEAREVRHPGLARGRFEALLKAALPD